MTDQQTVEEQAVVAAFTRFGADLGRAMVAAAMVAAAGLAGLFRRAASAAQISPAPHAMRPDYDLRCTVPGCGLGPEEH